MANQDELKLAHSGAWSGDEIKRLENMVASGFTNELIAKALGRKLQAVATRAHYLKKRQADETARLRKAWTPDEVATLERMIKAKANHKDIAAKLKRSTKAIEQRVHKLRKAKATADAKPQQIFTAPMPQPPAVKPVTLTPAQRAWARPEQERTQATGTSRHELGSLPPCPPSAATLAQQMLSLCWAFFFELDQNLTKCSAESLNVL